MTDSKLLMPPPPDFSDTGQRMLLIDGDAIAYMIGWYHKEHTDVFTCLAAVDQFMKEFFLLTDCRQYLGVISAEANRENFRYALYKYRPYKGTRKPDEEWIKFWKPIINKHLMVQYQFVRAPQHLETDDVIGALASNLEIYSDDQCIVCSPDKDLKQIRGNHYNYKTGVSDEVTGEKALWNLCIQLLAGCSSDFVAGVPGLGEVKAKALLAGAEPYYWPVVVKLAYQKYFGDYYGDIIYQETEHVIRLMTPTHSLWDTYGFSLEEYRSKIVISV